MRLSLRFSLLFLLVAVRCFGAEHVWLFEMRNRQYVPVANYDALVARLQPGDVLHFPDGSQFTITAPLNGNRFDGQAAGTNTLVLEVREGADGPVRALRVSRRADARHLLDEFVDGIRSLNGFNVPTVTIHRAVAEQYALVERLDVHFTLEDLVMGRLRPRGLDAATERLLYRELVEFARRVFMFADIGDFNLGQLAWVGDRWVLMDCARHHSLLASFNLGHAFHRMKKGEWEKLPRDVRDAINREIGQLRLQYPSACNLGLRRWQQGASFEIPRLEATAPVVSLRL